MKKDVSDMDYEKAYKDALERARKIKHDVQSIGCTNIGYMMDVDMLELIFPELSESEDERMIRKIEMFLSAYGADYFSNDEWREIEDWLEKQKEQEPITDSVKFEEGFKTGLEVGLRKQKEQKSIPVPPPCWESAIQEQKPVEWSEEDEKIIQSLILEIDKYVFFAGIEANKIISFLKSLRPSWKPSGEQMVMLRAVINDPNNAGAEGCQLALRELYEQLKKLT